MLVKLIRELVLLSTLLIIAVVALMINLSLKSDVKSTPEKGISIDTPKPIVNQAGKQLFRTNCASCHNKNMIDKMTGPALGGAVDRWNGNDVSIEEFINNAPAVLASGNTYANDLFRKFGTEMTAFPNLKKEEINSILLYIEEMYQRNR